MVVYPAIFTKESDGYSIEFPDLDGCYSCGNDLTHSVKMATEALDGYLASLIERNIPIPSPSKVTAIKADTDGEFVVMICGNPDKVLKKNQKNKAMKKTLTIPVWLGELADKNHVNYSSVLQEALKERLNV